MRKNRETISARLKTGAMSMSLMILTVLSFVVLLMVVVGIVKLISGLAV